MVLSTIKLDEIFNHAFVSITKKLASLELRAGSDCVCDDIKYRELVYTKGIFQATIVCDFSEGVFEHIISAMYGGSIPPEDMQVLYINEYVNIVCGRAVSEINDITGKSTRLTVPSFHSIDDKIKKDEENKDKFILEYKTDCGILRVSVYYDIGKP